jgi:hypothetical protein
MERSSYVYWMDGLEMALPWSLNLPTAISGSLTELLVGNQKVK